MSNRHFNKTGATVKWVSVTYRVAANNGQGIALRHRTQIPQTVVYEKNQS